MSMKSILAEISRDHFPSAPATSAEVEEFERRSGWRLDEDLRAFYLHCNGAALFERLDSPYRIRPLSHVQRARVDMRGEDSDEWGPASWYALGDMGDGDRILVDVRHTQTGRYAIIDGWHEGFPDPAHCPQVAASFSEFLEKALRSGGAKFWLE